MLAMALVLLMLLAIGGQTAWNLRKYRWLIRGEYTRARPAFVRQSRSWWRSVRTAAMYNVAVCDFNQGRLEEALAQLARLDGESLPPVIKELVDDLRASSLILLGRELPRAQALLSQVQQELGASRRALLLAYVAQLQGDAAAVNRHLQRAGQAPSRVLKAGTIITFLPAADDACAQHTVRGMLAEAQGDREKAVQAYRLAAASASFGLYHQRARERLHALGEASEEPVPPSLRPVVHG